MLIKVKFTFDCGIKLFDVFRPICSIVVILISYVWVMDTSVYKTKHENHAVYYYTTFLHKVQHMCHKHIY